MPFGSTLLTFNSLQVQFAQQPTLLICLCPPPRTLQTPAASSCERILLHPAYPSNRKRGKWTLWRPENTEVPMLLLKDTIHTVDYDRAKI